MAVAEDGIVRGSNHDRPAGPTRAAVPVTRPGVNGEPGFRLLDIGDGRQLARFGGLLVDRPYPAAVDPQRDPGRWAAADLRFGRSADGDGWQARSGVLPDAWTMRHADLVFELRPTASGQVGVFPEQIPLWDWLRAVARERTVRPRVLNLFAYTGGATLSLAMQGAAVSHVDGARASVAWARRNAVLSGLDSAPVRWLVDDALAFTRREARRDRRYDGLVLDPPSYGHGTRGRRWTLADDLPVLLDACITLLADEPAFVLLTAHTEGLTAARCRDVLVEALLRAGRARMATQVHAEDLMLRAESGASARAGVVARWPA